MPILPASCGIPAEINDRYVSVVWRDEFATWDFDALTRLVFLAHESRIRVSLSAVAPRYTRVMFHPRTHSGCVGKRHPNIDEAVAAFRAYLPENHRIIYTADK